MYSMCLTNTPSVWKPTTNSLAGARKKTKFGFWRKQENYNPVLSSSIYMAEHGKADIPKWIKLSSLLSLGAGNFREWD